MSRSYSSASNSMLLWSRRWFMVVIMPTAKSLVMTSRAGTPSFSANS